MAKRKYHRHQPAAPSASAAPVPAASPAGHQGNITTVTSLSEFRQEAERLRQSGYYEVPGALGGGTGGSGFHPDYAAYISAKLACEGDCGQQGKTDLPLLHVSSGYAQPVKTANGHDGKYITWGAGNLLPNVVSLLCSLSPYTAAALKFNVDLATGMGPIAMYSYTQYVGGNLTNKKVPYNQAGALILGLIRDQQRQLMNIDDTKPEAGEIKADIRKQIEELQGEYETWKQTRDELRVFTENNNLIQTFQQLNADMLQYNICFPEIELQQTYIDPITGHEVKTYNWHPKVTALRWRNAKTARLGQMNQENKIDYTYVSNIWLDDPTAVPDGTNGKIDAVRSLSAQSPAADMEKIIRDTRQANVHRNRRPTHFSCPIVYNLYGHPYYPVPAWYSIFSGDVYTYASILISDRKKRRDNANVIGRILYLNDEYVQRMYMQRQITDEKEKMKFFNEKIVGPINKFLQDRDNSGKPMLAYTFTGADGKEYKSWEIVEIQEASKSTAEANKEELAEISSIILFAWGVDSQLIGNTPGTTTRSGGTDLRERYLLKQIQMTPMQKLVVAVLDVVKKINRWDSHLVWDVERQVMTTLDRSKTGIDTAENQSEI